MDPKAHMLSLCVCDRTIITTYVPSMYIVSKTNGSRIRSDPPIRYLSQGEVKVEGAEIYETPNYLIGIAGAITSLVSVISNYLKSTVIFQMSDGVPYLDLDN